MTQAEDFSVSVPQAGLMIGKSTQQVYTLIQHRALLARCKGSRWFVSRDSIDRYMRTTDHQHSDSTPAVA